MPKFTIDPPSLNVSPDEFIEACSPREIDTLLDALKAINEDDFESRVQFSPERFLDRCQHWELERTYSLLREYYGIGDDDDARSEGQRVFNYHLTCLKEEWLSISNEDADIIAILAKKYGAL